MTRYSPPSKGGGGGGSGNVTVRHFPFAYNLAGLNNGVTLYTPTLGDIVLDAWIEVDTAWNGTTPLGDVGFNTSGTFRGWYHAITGLSLPMNQADAASGLLLGASALCGESLGPLSTIQNETIPTTNDGSGLYVVSGTAVNFIASPISTGERYFPFKVQIANPIQVVVSETGLAGGTAPGATQGSATLYLITATPA